MCAKKRHRSSSDFLHYLKDELSNQERHDLERGLEADPFEKEAMEGLESISPEKAEDDLLSLQVSLRKRLGRRKRVAWYSIAATAASILIVGTIFLNIYDLNPEDSHREPLTEESFRTLDSDGEKAGYEEETPVQVAEEKPPETVPAVMPEKSVEKAAEDIALTNEPAPSPVMAVTLEEEQEIEQEIVVMEYAVTEEADLEVVADPEVVAGLEVVAEAEPKMEIMAKKAEPPKIKRDLERQKMAAPAQVSILSGVVVSSEDMDPLPGASIKIRGTNSGTVADMEGRFTLPADDSQTTVTASFIGMESEEYLLESEKDNMLVMQPDALTLDEVVVVAHGVERVSAVSTRSRYDPDPSEEYEGNSYTLAEPAGGFKAFRTYMEENMVFPDEYSLGQREVVILKFTLSSTGKINAFQTLRSPGDSYTMEAIRLIREGPEWVPASRENVPIEEQVRIRIVFKK
ncbi:MAG: hypothetical protein GY790_04295 [Bacteroidetes bacterium]|nr:hypothetical protein [Bacteroidota bacterium]